MKDGKKDIRDGKTRRKMLTAIGWH